MFQKAFQITYSDITERNVLVEVTDNIGDFVTFLGLNPPH